MAMKNNKQKYADVVMGIGFYAREEWDWFLASARANFFAELTRQGRTEEIAEL